MRNSQGLRDEYTEALTNTAEVPNTEENEFLEPCDVCFDCQINCFWLVVDVEGLPLLQVSLDVLLDGLKRLRDVRKSVDEVPDVLREQIYGHLDLLPRLWTTCNQANELLEARLCLRKFVNVVHPPYPELVLHVSESNDRDIRAGCHENEEDVFLLVVRASQNCEEVSDCL